MKNQPSAVYELPRGSETILVGIDDARLRVRVRIALETCGYDVMAARTGAEALRLTELYRPSISLLICEAAMTARDGRAQAKRIAALAAAGHGDQTPRRHLGVLLLAEDCEAAAAASDLVACLQLPLRPSTLVAKVRQILDADPRTGRPDGLDLRLTHSNDNYLEN